MLLFRLIVGGLVAVFVAGNAVAERRVALVIGNSDYAETSDLANPVNDARLMTETLRNVGFEVTQITDVDQSQMKRAMLDFGRELRQGVDASLFYYAGHGVQAGGRNYLVPVDAAISDESELDFQAIDVNAFLRVMETSSSRVNIVVLDACRNNPFKSSFRSAARGLALVDAPKGTYIAYATAPGQVAEDGTLGNSPYTAALATAMSKPGLRIEDTFKQARATVLDVTSDRQVPWETSSITGDFYFHPSGAPQQSASKPQATPAFTTDATAAMAWSAIQNSLNIGDYEAFVGIFGAQNPFLMGLAESRIQALRQQQTASLPQAGSDTRPAVASGQGRVAIVPQTGHSDWIRELDWSPDGRQIVSASDDFSLRIWDVGSGGVLRILHGHRDWVRAVDWSSNGRWIASAGRDGSLIVWNAETGALISEFEGTQSGLLSVAWSPDDTMLATGGYGGAAELRDGSSGRLLQTLDGHSDWIRSVAWSPEGRFLATGSDDGTAIVWDVATGRLAQTLDGHSEYVKTVAWSPDGRLLATGSDDKFVKIWNAATGALNHTLGEFEDSVESVAWSPAGYVLATSDNRFGAKFWDGETGRLLHSMQEDYQAVQDLAWSPDGRTLASGGSDRDVELWDPTTGSRRAQFDQFGLAGQHVAISPDGVNLAVVSGGSEIDLWDMTDGRYLRRLSTPTGSIQTILWSPDGTEIAVGGSSNNVRIFSARTGDLRLDLSGHEDWVRSIAWSPDSRHLVSVGDDNKAFVWNTSSGSRELTMEGHTDWIFATAWSPDGRLIATGANDDEIRLWRASDGRLEQTITTESDSKQLLFSEDSRELLAIHGGESVNVWSTSDGSKVRDFSIDGVSIHRIAWSPDGRFLIAADRIVDRAGRPVATLGSRPIQVQSVYWSNRGNTVGTLQAGPTLVLWDTQAFQKQMTLFFGQKGNLGILYPDGSAYASTGGEDFFAIVDGNEIVRSTAGYESLFRSRPTLPH